MMEQREFRIDSSGNVKVGSACTISQDGDVFFTGVQLQQHLLVIWFLVVVVQT